MSIDVGELKKLKDNEGESLYGRSIVGPVLLIFLRQFGCPFCRETVSTVSHLKEEFEKRHVHVVFVHMSDAKAADFFFSQFDLSQFSYICDLNKEIYKLFEIPRGQWGQVLALNSLKNAFKIFKFGMGPLQGDGFQMPGCLLISKGKVIVRAAYHSAADQPDYLKLVTSAMAKT